MKTFCNPVHEGSCPDPFVLKHAGTYWCYRTGDAGDGRKFEILSSPDLVHWQPLHGALDPLPGDHTCYWAPEVAYLDGTFYMYYSVGNETTMQLRVATAERPEGPWRDSGRGLTTEEFAIDAHVFEAKDGSRWLFYATDFLSHSHVGTGTVRDRLVDPLTLAGDPRPVTRARYDWQVYDPARKEKGGVRWHTVEGPFVLERKGRFYQMFSGGNWQNVTYGVSFAVADRLDLEGEWEQLCDGERVRPILATIPDRVIGPGHNSVVRGPDNRQLVCIYHRWSPELGERVLCIDRLEFIGDRLDVLGPSTGPEPALLAPIEWDLPKEPLSGERRLTLDVPTFACEVTLTPPTGGDHARAGLRLVEEGGTLWEIEIDGAGHPRAGGRADVVAAPRPDVVLRPGVPHLVRLDVNGGWLVASIDGARWTWSGWIEGRVDGLALFADDGAARFEAFELTRGWQDDFDVPGRSVEQLDWRAVSDPEGPETPPALTRLAAGQFVVDAPEGPAEFEKAIPFAAYELVVNARLVRDDPGASWGVRPARTASGPGPLLSVGRRGGAWSLLVQNEDETHEIPLPLAFDGLAWQQLRVRRGHGLLRVYHGARRLLEIPAPAEPSWPGVQAQGGIAAFEMVRLTGVPDALQMA